MTRRPRRTQCKAFPAIRILSGDDRIKSLIFLPFNTPQEAERTVEQLGDKKGVIGFCVTSTRYKPVHRLVRLCQAGLASVPLSPLLENGQTIS